MDEMVDPSLTVKIIGHQWYWSYEYTNFLKNNLNLNFDSFMVPFEDLTFNQTGSELTEKSRHFRNLEVDKKLNLPIYTQVRLLVSSADVLHSWTIPSFGIKIDACPGRLNQAQLQVSRYGTYFGQCSEICGVGHSFMPISVEVRSLSAFLGQPKAVQVVILPSPNTSFFKKIYDWIFSKKDLTNAGINVDLPKAAEVLRSPVNKEISEKVPPFSKTEMQEMISAGDRSVAKLNQIWAKIKLDEEKLEAKEIADELEEHLNASRDYLYFKRYHQNLVKIGKVSQLHSDLNRIEWDRQEEIRLSLRDNPLYPSFKKTLEKAIRDSKKK
jgi:hypothetical protein